MLSRSVRAETRQSRKEDIKRVMHSIDKVEMVLSCVHCKYSFLSVGETLGKEMGCDS